MSITSPSFVKSESPLSPEFILESIWSISNGKLDNNVSPFADITALVNVNVDRPNGYPKTKQFCHILI
jgi:hypothetical protein